MIRLFGPIPFSTPMVLAIMHGRKTMTRRAIAGIPSDAEFNYFFVDSNCKDVARFVFQDGTDKFIHPKCVTGDIFYVRESWRIGAWEANLNDIAVDYRNEVRREWIHVPDTERFERYVGQSIKDAQRAGIIPNGNGEYHWKPGDAPTRWRPPRFMPREVARIFLRVTNVRVERLCDITDADAIREGVLYWDDVGCCCSNRKYRDYSTGEFSIYEDARRSFATLWDSINAKRGGGLFDWIANPWVWVINFDQITKEEAMKEVA